MFKFSFKVIHDTVDGITSDFNEMATKLEDLAGRKADEEAKHNAEAIRLQGLAAAAAAEQAKARAVIENIRNIFTTVK